MRAYGNRILVKLTDEGDKRLDSGLFLPAGLSGDLVTGVIVSVGHGHFTSSGNVVALHAKVGETAYFLKGAGHEYLENGEKYVVLKDNELELVSEGV